MKPRHQAIDGVVAALQQHVHVVRLWRHAARRGHLANLVAIKHDNLIHVRGDNARREHARDARTNDDSTLAEGFAGTAHVVTCESAAEDVAERCIDSVQGAEKIEQVDVGFLRSFLLNPVSGAFDDV